MDKGTLFIICVIAIAYLFDFINGFHDAANTIATIVTTGVLTPRMAVLWAALFNFVAFLFFNLMVAHTIGHDLIETSMMDSPLIFSALIGAIIWNLITWYLGLPSSSSHALIGGLAGAALIRGGIHVLNLAGFIKVAIGIVLSPLVGLFASLLIGHILLRLFHHHNPHRLKLIFQSIQLLSSAFLSLAHGGNDAQKTMGIIAMLLFSTHWLHGSFYIPSWVVFSCYAVISLGTLAGGWKIINTMGNKITTLDTLRGTSAEACAALIIFVSTDFGIPVSTTQTVTGTIAGIGLTQGLHGVHWPTIRAIFLSWLFTIPASGLIAAILSLLF